MYKLIKNIVLILTISFSYNINLYASSETITENLSLEKNYTYNTKEKELFLNDKLIYKIFNEYSNLQCINNTSELSNDTRIIPSNCNSSSNINKNAAFKFIDNNKVYFIEGYYAGGKAFSIKYKVLVFEDDKLTFESNYFGPGEYFRLNTIDNYVVFVKEGIKILTDKNNYILLFYKD